MDGMLPKQRSAAVAPAGMLPAKTTLNASVAIIDLMDLMVPSSPAPSAVGHARSSVPVYLAGDPETSIES
jgi:hypothetical protein